MGLGGEESLTPGEPLCWSMSLPLCVPGLTGETLQWAQVLLRQHGVLELSDETEWQICITIMRQT